MTYYFPGKRVERGSNSSSPETEKPPAKSVNFQNLIWQKWRRSKKIQTISLKKTSIRSASYVTGCITYK